MLTKDILRNAFVLYITKILGFVLNFYFIVLVANYLGPGGFGSLSFALSFAAIFKILSDLGLRQYVARETSRDLDSVSRYLINSLIIKLILSAITGIAVVLSVALVNQDRQADLLIYLVSFSIIVSSMTDLFYSLFQASERMEFQAIGELLKRAILLAGAFAGVYRGISLVEIGYLYVLSAVIPLVFSIYVAHNRLFSFEFDLDLTIWKPMVINSLPFGLSVFFVTTRYNLDIFLLRTLESSASAGWFNASYKLVWAALFIPRILTRVVFPSLSRQYKESKTELNQTYARVFKYLLALGIPVGVGTVILANQFILRIYSAEYRPSVLILQLLIWSGSFLFLTNIFDSLFNAMDQQRLVTRIAAIAALLNGALDLFLIQYYGYVGATVATVISDGLIIALYTIIISRTPKLTSPTTLAYRYAVPILVPTFVMAGVLLAVRDIIYDIVVLIPLGALVYGLVFYFAGGITEAEIREVRDAIANE